MDQPAEGDIQSVLRMFSVVDYVVLTLLLMVCVGIGIYYGFFRGEITTEDYLVGGRKMKLLPTSLSLIATLVTGLTLLGTPADTYLNGSQFVYSSFGYMLAGFVIPWAFLPVLHQMRLTTVYEYLELRFNRSVRLFISALFIIKMIIAIPKFIYPPAVVFNQVTGESLQCGSALLTIVCIFYTCVGGFKAVVWTDVLQCLFMIGSILLVIIKGTIDIGGPSVVFERSNAGGRLEAPNFDLNPTIYYTIWSLTIGNFFKTVNQNAFYQGMLQRYISIPKLGTAKNDIEKIRFQKLKTVPVSDCLIISNDLVDFIGDGECTMLPSNSTLTHTLAVNLYKEICTSWPSKTCTVARAAFITNCVGAVLFTVMCSYFGLLIYAEFHDCDPITTKVAKGKDQVVPLFVMKTLGKYPGLPGIFVAGIFSAALSTVSSVLNALSGVALEDYYKPFIKRPVTQRESNILMKTVVIVFGIAGGALVYVIEKIGTIMQITFSVGTMTDGPSLGVFLMGFLLPCVNTQGVLAGAISGMAFSLWIVIGSEVAVASGYKKYTYKPMSVEGCLSDFRILNSTIVKSSAPDNSDIFVMHRLSSFWNVPLTCVVTVLVGVVVSYLTGVNDITNVDRRLLSPVIRKFVPKPKSTSKHVSLNDYKPVELQIIPKDTDMDGRTEKLLNETGKII